jgi:hypothetical protein
MHGTSFKKHGIPNRQMDTLVMGILLNTPGASSSSSKETTYRHTHNTCCVQLLEHSLLRFTIVSVCSLNYHTPWFGVKGYSYVYVCLYDAMWLLCTQDFHSLSMHVEECLKIHSPSILCGMDACRVFNKPAISRCDHLECDDIWPCEMWARAEGYELFW